MNKTNFKLLVAILTVGAAGVFAAYVVSAQVSEPPQVSSRPDITFPVAELNNCKSETECRTYCDKPENIDACVDFARKHGLMTANEAAKAKQFKDVVQVGGPGGCKGQTQCESYCNDQTHMDECISFAEKHDLMPADDLAEAKKVNEALKQGAKLPGNCKGKQQCETYCKTPEHAEECLDFASKAGFIPPDQAEQARKMMELVKSGDAPQECLAGKDQCQQYCSEETHRDQCANFMVKAGFMKPEDAEAFKKTGGKGPGGCQSKDECEAFCNAPENQKTCFQFGKDKGLIPPDQLKQIQENADKTKNAIDTAPAEVKQCLQSTVSSDVLREIESGSFLPTKNTGEQLGQQMQKCFEQFMPKNQEREFPGGRGPGGPGDHGRPEFERGNQDNQGELPPVGDNQRQFQGPGGCSSAEECAKYCSDPSHASECGNLKSGERQQEYRPPAGREQQQENQPPASPVPMMSRPSEGFPQPNPSGQPIQSFNPQMPFQSTQSQPPSGGQPNYSGKPYPTTERMPQEPPIQQIQQSSLPPPPSQPPSQLPPPPPPLSPSPSPSSFISSFFALIARFIMGAR